MLTKAEEKDIREKAYGKRITFATRHHWILTWLEEQPGKNLADKVWGVIDRAYRADCAMKGHSALGRYWPALERQDFGAMSGALCEAIGYYSNAGEREKEELARGLLYSVIYRENAS